ncbi:hypothetical protein BABINDRAFT_167581 [Babjeviella inositovora NRRL Y-12698]|uniref:Uncharacterized protein n=1 Tax=Babjeviella inositovora NRRL Y-12698 TaxID=984486 RepID=A0A1E3QMX2_9ASCO|nr:uncharacterized protein BABINDRAFT_167581 [Babjeviella inositovora NRRL Y-12698]ODQ79035.1 hypothetical protein BABINDRAFT_167581 [Babjeviella inositovora NRRL Y-12698]
MTTQHPTPETPSETQQLEMMQRFYRKTMDYVHKNTLVFRLWHTVLHLHCHNTRTPSRNSPVVALLVLEFSIRKRFMVKYYARFNRLRRATHARHALQTVLAFVAPVILGRTGRIVTMDLEEPHWKAYLHCLLGRHCVEMELVYAEVLQSKDDRFIADVQWSHELMGRAVKNAGEMDGLDTLLAEGTTLYNEMMAASPPSHFSLETYMTNLSFAAERFPEHQVPFHMYLVREWAPEWVDLLLDDMALVMHILASKADISGRDKSEPQHMAPSNTPSPKTTVLTNAKLKKQAKKQAKAAKQQTKLNKTDIRSAARFIMCLKDYAEHAISLARLALYLLNYAIQVVKERTIESQPVLWCRTVNELDTGLRMVDTLTANVDDLLSYTNTELPDFFMNGERMHLSWIVLLQGLYKACLVLKTLAYTIREMGVIDCEPTEHFRNCLSIMLITAANIPYDETFTFKDCACDDRVFVMVSASLKFFAREYELLHSL